MRPLRTHAPPHITRGPDEREAVVFGPAKERKESRRTEEDERAHMSMNR